MAGERSGWHPGFRASLLTAALVLSLLFSAVPAVAGVGDYPMPWRIYWKPTSGSVITYNTASGYPPHHVGETFQWGHWLSLAMVDTPRTHDAEGTYEHEVRFFTGGDGIRWCDPAFGTRNVVLDMPYGSYQDVADVDDDEFTWGLRTWRLVQGHVYNIDFDCFPTWDNVSSPSNEYNLTGQLGHCHLADGCTSYNTYADETVRIVPRIQGRAPETQTWRRSFAGTWGYENGMGEWHAFNGTASRVCDNPYPYEGSCYVFVHDDGSSSSGPYFYFSYSPSPSAAGTASVYLEFASVRCPTLWNGGNCSMRFRIEGYASNGSLTSDVAGPWWSVTRDDQWYILPSLKTGAFPTGTVTWQFRLEAANGVSFDADYSQASWHLPR
jgi:hypothetical protein